MPPGDVCENLPSQRKCLIARTSLLIYILHKSLRIYLVYLVRGWFRRWHHCGQGHVRLGPDTVTDPAFLVTRAMEDFVTWVDTSKIKRKVAKYNDAIDDFDLLA